MNDADLRKLLVIAASGVVAFFLILLAILIYLFVAFIAVGFPFGGGKPSYTGGLILFGFVPIMISFASALPAWALGAKFWYGLLSGMTSLATSGCLLFMMRWPLQ